MTNLFREKIIVIINDAYVTENIFWKKQPRQAAVINATLNSSFFFQYLDPKIEGRWWRKKKTVKIFVTSNEFEISSVRVKFHLFDLRATQYFFKAKKQKQLMLMNFLISFLLRGDKWVNFRLVIRRQESNLGFFSEYEDSSVFTTEIDLSHLNSFKNLSSRTFNDSVYIYN